MSLKQDTRIVQKQILSQTQIQGLELLAMDNIELAAFMQNEYMENPLLDYREREQEEVYKDQYNRREDHLWNRDDEAYSRKEAAVWEENPIKEFILGQLDLTSFSEAELKLAEFMIACLDDNGYMTVPLEEVAEKCNRKEAVVQEMWEILREVEPYGIFSYNLSQCLIQQLWAKGIDNPELEQIIEHYLQEVSAGKVGVISRAMSISTLQVRKYIAMIEQLKPKPLAGMYQEQCSYVIPDVVCKKEGDQWDVVLNERYLGECSLNSYYLEMMRKTRDQELTEYFKKKAERARLLIQNIEKRKQTLLKISRLLLDAQQDFFEGNGGVEPLTMAELADAAELSISTVSRSVKGKYMQYPGGTVAMKTLFASAAADNEGRGHTAQEVKSRIKELILKENTEKPYSDQELADILQRQGIKISRRAVAKYREESGIRRSYERRKI